MHGILHVDQMLASMTEKEFREWWLWMDEIEPCGPLVDNYHAALIASMVRNCSGRTYDRMIETDQLMFGGKQRRSQSPEQIDKMVQAIASRAPKELVKRKKKR